MKLIQEIVESADRKVRQAREGKKWLMSPPVKKILDSLDYLSEKHSASKSAYFDGCYNSVYLTLKELSGLKDEGLAALLNSMLHHEPTRTETEDHARSFSRDYIFIFESSSPEFWGRLRVVITANFKEDSETCKRVVVGYTEPSKEATPIYELRCEDSPTVETNQETI